MKKGLILIIVVIVLAFCISSCGNLMNDILSEITEGKNATPAEPEVEPVAVTGVSLDTGSCVIPIGFTEQLAAVVEPPDAENQSISWSSSNDSIAVVNSDGLVNSVGEGTAAITVTTEDGGYTSTCTVEVITPPTTEKQKLLASDGNAGDAFGFSADMHGNCAVIGAFHYDTGGAVYVFNRDSSGNWNETTTLLPEVTAIQDLFGYSVDLIEGCVVIGAGGHDGNDTNSGAVYVFEQDGSGNWSESQKLIAADGGDSDTLGESVAISEYYIFAGAYKDDDKGTDSGAAYVFERDGSGNWNQAAKLTASDGDDSDYLGRSVGVTENHALVGAPNSADGNGAVYTFTRDASGNWNETGKLTPSDDGTASEHFGRSIAISGEYALIGCWYDDDKGTQSGSAYIFKHDGSGNWTETAKLIASDGAADDHFGESVALSGNYAVIGAPDNDNLGSAYVFQRDTSGTWSELAILTPTGGAAYDYFGESVAVSGGYAAIGGSGDDDKGAGSGSAYIYE